MSIDRDTVNKMIDEGLRPWSRRLAGLVVRGVVRVLSEAGLQRAQVTATADDILEDVEMITPPGFTSRPKQAEAIVFAVQGAAGHRVAFMFDRTTRLQELEDGEAALYVGREGQKVKLFADGGIEVRAAGTAESSIVLKPNGDIVITPGALAKVLLGGESATQLVALAGKLKARLDLLASQVSGWTPVAMDGGAALKAILTFPGIGWATGNNDCGSDNVCAKGG